MQLLFSIHRTWCSFKILCNFSLYIKEFGEFDFGEMPLEVMHLSKRGEYEPDGFYKCIEKFELSNFLT